MEISKAERQMLFSESKSFIASKLSANISGSAISGKTIRSHKASILNPKLLEKVIRTINRRPSVSDQFQQGLAKTAEKTWNAHLAARKKMSTRNQKIVEEIASNLGLGKGYQHHFQDEAERLVSILFKEINKKKSEKEEIISWTSSSEESVEEESYYEIESFTEEVHSPLTPKLSAIPAKRISSRRTDQKRHSCLLVSKSSLRLSQGKIEKEELPSNVLHQSILNVTKIQGTDLKEASKESLHRTYVQIPTEKNYFINQEKKEHLRSKVAKAKLPLVSAEIDALKADPNTLKQGTAKDLKGTIQPVSHRGSKFLNILDFKSVTRSKDDTKQECKDPVKREIVDDFRMRWEPMKATKMEAVEESIDFEKTPIRLTKLIPRSDTDILDHDLTLRRSSSIKQQKKKLNIIDEKTKNYVMEQIRKMLHMMTYSKETTATEADKRKRRHTKSIFVLWKNYFDVKHMENITEESVGLRKTQRNNLLNEVEIELMKTIVYGRIAAILGESAAKSPYEHEVADFMKAKTNELRSEMQNSCDKKLEQDIQILEQQANWSRTPEHVLLEEERREKLIVNYHASLFTPAEKYGGKRPNTRETTLEEILQMRGFRGRIKNRKHTIWIKKPEFIGYLKPMKKKPRTVYEPPETKEIKPVLEHKSKQGYGSEEMKTFEMRESVGAQKGTIRRSPITLPSSIVKPSPKISKKRSRPLKPVHGFKKYFGSLCDEEKPPPTALIKRYK